LAALYQTFTFTKHNGHMFLVHSIVRLPHREDQPMKTHLMASPILAPDGACWGVRMQNRGHGRPWQHYKRTLLAAQLAIGLLCWLAYQAAAPDLVPAATAFIIMQVSALVGSMWANRLQKAPTSSGSSALN
jgi:hypothetical protein